MRFLKSLFGWKRKDRKSEVGEGKTALQLVEEYANDLFPNIRIQEKFNGLYRKITGEDRPENVRLAVLPYEHYAKIHRIFNKKEPSISSLVGNGSYSGNIEFAFGYSEEHLIVVLDNTEYFLLEAMSHGIGHVRHAMEFYKSNNKIREETDSVVRESAGHVAVQIPLYRCCPKDYVKTRYFIEVIQHLDEESRSGAEYASKLIKKYGIDEAWNLVLDARKENDLIGLICQK